MVWEVTSKTFKRLKKQGFITGKKDTFVIIKGKKGELDTFKPVRVKKLKKVM